MYPMRKLLYHRGVDDHVGTYATDYVYSGVCFLLCVHLAVRIYRERRLMTQEQRVTSSCWDFSNWLPWNWPKEKSTTVTMSTYAVLLFGFSNFVMMLLGGLTHQFLQTVEPYDEDVNQLWDWLIIWRVGASFSALVCFSLLIMAEQLIIQEGFLRIPRVFRVFYYIIVITATICFFGVNYVPLTGRDEDPFSIRQSFTVTFGVVCIYGITAAIVVIRQSCGCRSRMTSRPYSTEYEAKYSPAHSVDSKLSPERTPRRKIYSCCKSMVSGCHSNDDVDDVTSRRWDLFVTLIAPWVFVAAGGANQFLKSKCADSDAAQSELGCPLPDSFNHNALMHVVQILSAFLFFLAENLAITRRSHTSASNIRRATTSSTIYNDVINSCVIIDAKAMEANAGNTPQNEITNNNRCDDVICNISMDEKTKDVDDVMVTSLPENDNASEREPKFPTILSYEVAITDNRQSVYDNLSDA